MATKKINNTPELIAEQARIALEKIAQFQPDVVLILDDNAFRTVGLPLSGKPVAIVFCGLNVQPEDYNRIQPFMKDRLHPGGNITGIYEKLHIREGIKVLASMHDIKKFLFLDDLSPTGKAIAKQVDLEINSEEGKDMLPCEIEQATMHSWEEYRETIEAINKSDEIGAFYLGALLLKDAAGNSYTAAEIIPYTIEHANKPAMAPNYAFIKLGLFGGLSVDFYAMGKQAGLKVVQILSGSDPGQLPIDDAKKVAIVFNLTRAEKLGIKIPSDILLAADEVFRK
ncbi:ABC transporter substrate binding protein [uncultured Desulfosarcina sp.]|uniref:ABC transporter substrate-binding protein n=1 Tax=uncultured Desulfosarcina sp. TaxID=218289 RepID=UPI0029C8F052|nr:ABC transporter substrate binding protein [uncultured Desulfosarcina sp.]